MTDIPKPFLQRFSAGLNIATNKLLVWKKHPAARWIGLACAMILYGIRVYYIQVCFKQKFCRIRKIWMNSKKIFFFAI